MIHYFSLLFFSESKRRDSVYLAVASGLSLFIWISLIIAGFVTSSNHLVEALMGFASLSVGVTFLALLILPNLCHQPDIQYSSSSSLSLLSQLPSLASLSPAMVNGQSDTVHSWRGRYLIPNMWSDNSFLIKADLCDEIDEGCRGKLWGHGRPFISDNSYRASHHRNNDLLYTDLNCGDRRLSQVQTDCPYNQIVPEFHQNSSLQYNPPHLTGDSSYCEPQISHSRQRKQYIDQHQCAEWPHSDLSGVPTWATEQGAPRQRHSTLNSESHSHHPQYPYRQSTTLNSESHSTEPYLDSHSSTPHHMFHKPDCPQNLIFIVEQRKYNRYREDYLDESQPSSPDWGEFDISVIWFTLNQLQRSNFMFVSLFLRNNFSAEDVTSELCQN